MTFSVGVADTTDGSSFQDVVAIADSRLRAAKAAGKARVDSSSPA